MKKPFLPKAIALGLVSFLALIAYADMDKVIQVFKNGEIIQEFTASEIDYIEVNDLIPSPTGLTTTVTSNEITISWEAVENATYNVYRSADNENFTPLATGIETTSYTDKSPLSGMNYYRVTAIVDGQESKNAPSEGAVFSQADLPSGIYLGIYGFSKGFQTYPLEHLSDQNTAAYHSFINGLTATEAFTWLYYAVDKSIDKLESTSFPKDLSQVAVVTFTDGLDIGSLDEMDKIEPGKYLSTAAYRDALHTRLTAEKVSGTEISAYTIGIIQNKTGNLTTFRNNMKSLATSSSNVYEVSDINNLEKIFKEIANSLSETKYIQNFVLSISGQSHNEKCRFTFDNVTSYSASKLYIEGIYNRQTRSLTDITYYGLTSSSGSTVQGVYNETDGKYDFTFENLQANDGKLIPTDHVNHWFTDEGIWQDVDDEFFFSPDDASLQKIKRSAAIMLNLDCSSSMAGDKLNKLKVAANSFVQTLADNTIDPDEVSSVSLNRTSVKMETGSGLQLLATVLPSTAKLKTVTWKSSNTAVATVDDDGYVSAVAPGTATITVTTKDGGFTATCIVEVVKLVESIEISPASISMYVGDKANVTTTVLPNDATNKEIQWSVSDRSLASVSENTVTALTAGSGSIIAQATDGSGKKAYCSINILQHVEGITLNTNSADLPIGSTLQLSATVSPANASNKNIRWASSNPAIATVDQDGLVTPLAKGAAVITATGEDGGLSATCAINVTQPVTSINLNTKSASLNVGETIQLSATALPDNADNKSIVWSSLKPAVATVSGTGLVTAKAPGSVNIIAASEGSGVQAMCTVTVNQPLTGISLSTSSLTLEKGRNATLKLVPTPADATNLNFEVTSSDTSVATVSKSGSNIIVTGAGFGSATITVTAEEGGYTSTATVTVTPSTTISNLALAIKKDGVRYYIPYDEYTSVPAGYSKEGLAISYGLTSFILKLTNATSSRLTFTQSKSYGTCPTSTQAQAIVANWSSVNSALLKYGGASLGSNSYWTSTGRGTGNQGYYYSSSGVVFATTTTATNFVRCVAATL